MKTPSADDQCQGGEPCWRNPETGYMEYCPKHEAIIADKAMDVDRRLSVNKSSGEVSMETMTHWWNKETTGAECGDVNAANITPHGYKVTCPECLAAASQLPTALAGGACLGSVRVSNTTNGDDITVGCLLRQGHGGNCRFPSTAFQPAALAGELSPENVERPIEVVMGVPKAAHPTDEERFEAIYAAKRAPGWDSHSKYVARWFWLLAAQSLPPQESAELVEITRWQNAIYALLQKAVPDANVDGGGCDSGDPLDFTLSEISQALGYLKSERDFFTAEMMNYRINKMHAGRELADTLAGYDTVRADAAEAKLKAQESAEEVWERAQMAHLSRAMRFTDDVDKIDRYVIPYTPPTPKEPNRG